MKLVFLYGLPGAGKLTIGKELSRQTGFKLFHNHLTVDFVSSIFDFGTPAFVEAREDIWLLFFELASKYKFPGMIFTFAPEKTVRPDFIDKVNDLIGKNRDDIYFVQLICDQNVLKTRIADPSRKNYDKLISPEKLHSWLQDGTYFIPEIGGAFRLDTTHLTPAESAKRIVDYFSLV